MKTSNDLKTFLAVCEHFADEQPPRKLIYKIDSHTMAELHNYLNHEPQEPCCPAIEQPCEHYTEMEDLVFCTHTKNENRFEGNCNKEDCPL